MYRRFRKQAPRIPLRSIVEFLDTQPQLRQLVQPYVDEKPVWDGQPQREAKGETLGR